MGTQGTGRKRSTKKDKSTAEDDALNLIAREAEARLAAKRAARAEAREIRMKELERQQKELSDDDERMSVGSRGSVRVEDRDYLEKGSRAASALTAATLTSLGGSSSRRGSGETAITVDAETSLREIKDALAEVEEKYRKAMVSNAQLDNEKNNLMYQVDTLKDSLMELEELLSESHRGYEEKVKELEREKHAHSVLQFQFNEMKEMLKQSEELLNKHGIVLGPDLNINGDIGEAQVDGSPSADPASQPAPDSQPSPTEGNSMLGSTEETQLRSSGDEEVDPEQHQEMFEESKENHLSSETLCNVASVSTLERLREDEPTEEQQTCSATEEDTVEESHLDKDLSVDNGDSSTTETKDTVDGLGLQGIVPSSEENKPETETPEGGGLGETSNPDLGEAETKGSRVDAHSDEIRESCNNAFEEQENKQEDVEESNLRIPETCPQQNVARDVIKETEENEPQQEPENPEEAENDEAEEMSSKSQPQGATASGKKKKKRKRGKKKGGAQENKTQQKDDTDKEKGKTEKVESAPADHGPSTEPGIDGSVTQPLEVSRVDLVKNEQDRQETEEVAGEEAVKPTETLSHNQTLQESGVDHVTDEHDKKQTLETDIIEVEAVTTTETVSHIDTPIEIRVDHVMDEVNEEQSLEVDTVETVEAVAPIESCSPVEALSESSTDPKKDEQQEEQSLEAETVEAVTLTETFSPVETLQESETSLKKDAQDEEQSLEAVEAVAPIETCSPVEALNESSTDPKKDEQDEEQMLEAEEAEVGSTTSAVPEGSLCTPDLIVDSKGAENTVDLDEVCTPIVDNSKNEIDLSTNGTVIHPESEIIDSAADEVGSVNKIKSESTTSDPETTFDTNRIENTEVESQVPSNVDVAADESESQNSSESKDGMSPSLSSIDDCLSGSEPPSEPSAAVNSGSDDTPTEVSDEDPKEATETVKDDEEPAAQTEQESFSRSHDGNNSELKPDGTDEEELNEDVNKPEALIKSESPSHEEESAICDSASLTNNTEAVHTEDCQTSRSVDQIDESNIEDSPKEATEIVSSIEQDHGAEESAIAEDPELENSQNDKQTEAQLELHEPSKDQSKDNDSSRPTLQDSDIEDEEEGEDDEGQSFDFDDMDMELAVETNIPKDPKHEEVEEGVEVMSDESNSGSSGLCQSNTESNENTQDGPVENNDEKCAVDGGNQVDTLDEEATSGHVSEVQINTPEEEVVVADEPVVGEEKALIVGEPGDVAGNNTQATPLPVEEGLDAIEHELQGENAALPKSADQVASNKEPPQAKKDPKKNSKKGKPKGKEDCKMS